MLLQAVSKFWPTRYLAAGLRLLWLSAAPAPKSGSVALASGHHGGLSSSAAIVAILGPAAPRLRPRDGAALRGGHLCSTLNGSAQCYPSSRHRHCCWWPATWWAAIGSGGACGARTCTSTIFILIYRRRRNLRSSA